MRLQIILIIVCAVRAGTARSGPFTLSGRSTVQSTDTTTRLIEPVTGMTTDLSDGVTDRTRATSAATYDHSTRPAAEASTSLTRHGAELSTAVTDRTGESVVVTGEASRRSYETTTRPTVEGVTDVTRHTAVTTKDSLKSGTEVTRDSLKSGTEVTADVSRATLRLFVSRVLSAGTLELRLLTAPFDEAKTEYVNSIFSDQRKRVSLGFTYNNPSEAKTSIAVNYYLNSPDAETLAMEKAETLRRSVANKDAFIKSLRGPQA